MADKVDTTETIDVDSAETLLPKTEKKIFGALRVRQPAELYMTSPARSTSALTPPATSPEFTKLLLSNAFENLQSTIRKSKEEQQRQNSAKSVFDRNEKVHVETLIPRVNFVTSIYTGSPPLQSANTNARQTISCIIWVHLQASICTEWEQSSMILMPGSNIGARVTSKPFGSKDNVPTIQQMISSIDNTPPGSTSQKKPKTIHRCILQRAAKAKSLESLITCHVCEASYPKYNDYYQHLIDQTCAKNTSNRVTSPTAKEPEIRTDKPAEQKLPSWLKRRRSLLSSDESGEAEDEVQIEAEFLNCTPPKQLIKVISLGHTTTVTTTTATTTMSSDAAPTLRSLVKRGRPVRLDLAALNPQASHTEIMLTPPLTKEIHQHSHKPRELHATELISQNNNDNSLTPLNLSTKATSPPHYRTRPTDQIHSAEPSMPPLMPIHEIRGANSFRISRDVLGSTGSGTELSSNETSPNETFADSPNFSNNKNGDFSKIVLTPTVDKKLALKFKYLEPFLSPTLTITPTTSSISNSFSTVENKSSSNDFVSMDAAMLCPHRAAKKLPPLSLTEHANDQSLLANLKSNLTKYLGAKLGEDQLVGRWNYPEADILTVVQNIIDHAGGARGEVALRVGSSCSEACKLMAPTLPVSQLRFRLLRQEIFVARSNVAKLLKIFHTDKRLMESLIKNPVEKILEELLFSIQRESLL